MIRSKLTNSLDLSSFVQESGNEPAMSLSQAINTIRSMWVAGANENLHTTAKDYIDAMRINVHKGASGITATLSLDSVWARKLEYGYPAYDMKSVYSRSSKRKKGEDGQWYLHVPFRHTSPASTGKTGAKMPSSIYKKASAMPQWGKMTTSNKSDIYNGMTRVPESETSSRSAYMTWRTVSENSDPVSWLHPGFRGVHLIENMAPIIQDTFSQVFEPNASHILGNNRRQ
jgi:hypothetical protein